MSGSPASNWSGLLGRRVEPRRAGMTPRTRITKGNRAGGPSQKSCRGVERTCSAPLWSVLREVYSPLCRAQGDSRWGPIHQAQEIGQKTLSVVGADRLGVELHPVD